MNHLTGQPTYGSCSRPLVKAHLSTASSSTPVLAYLGCTCSFTCTYEYTPLLKTEARKDTLASSKTSPCVASTNICILYVIFGSPTLRPVNSPAGQATKTHMCSALQQPTTIALCRQALSWAPSQHISLRSVWILQMHNHGSAYV